MIRTYTHVTLPLQGRDVIQFYGQLMCSYKWEGNVTVRGSVHRRTIIEEVYHRDDDYYLHYRLTSDVDGTVIGEVLVFETLYQLWFVVDRAGSRMSDQIINSMVNL